MATAEEYNSHIDYTGLLINGRQYPSEPELASISLRQLSSIRPNNAQGREKDHFYHLFSSHPDLTKLNKDNPKRYLQDWVRIWCNSGEGETKVYSKKLCHAIEHYLHRCADISQEFAQEILRTCKRVKGVLTQRRRRHFLRDSTDPEHIERRRKMLEHVSLHGRNRTGGNVFKMKCYERFKSLLQHEKVPIDIPAEELEIVSRSFRAAIEDTRVTTVNLRMYLEIRGDNKKIIDQAIESRKEYNAQQTSLRSNERLNTIRGSQSRRGKKKSIIHRENKNIDEHFQLLVSQSNWWAV